MRKLEYDWVRVFALAVVVLFHSSLPFTDQRWVINYSVVHPVPSEYMSGTAWRTTLFFFISGIVGGIGATERTDVRSLMQRLKRILIPLAFGVLIVVPPQIYIELVQKLNYQSDFVTFLIFDCFRPCSICAGDVCVSLLAWKHLWYLGYLAIFTLLASTMLGGYIIRGQAFVADGGNFCRFVSVLFIGLVCALAIRFVVWIELQPDDLRFLPLTAIAGASLVFYLVGRILARAELGWRLVSRHSLPLLALCAFIYFSLLVSTRIYGVSCSSYVGFGVFLFLMVIAIVGLFKRYVNKDSALIEYSSRYVVVYFLWHQTVIVILYFFLNKMAVPAVFAFAVAILSVVCFGWVVSKVCERVPLIAFVHGVAHRR